MPHCCRQQLLQQQPQLLPHAVNNFLQYSYTALHATISYSYVTLIARGKANIMAKKKGNKKKGAGQERTALKTSKKMEKAMKKELGGSGDRDIEEFIAELERKDAALVTITVTASSAPSPRSYATLCVHPSKEELILFGGEYFNGQTTQLYNDLFFFNVAKNEWRKVSCPTSPLPRSSHQMAVLERDNEGQVYVFGGEFTSPNGNQFHHYNDLWLLHLSSNQWEKIAAKGGPSARSGHRMVAYKRKLFVFGGFYDNGAVVRFFDDLHIFDLDKMSWTKVAPGTNMTPPPRSGFPFFVREDTAYLYGGFAKSKKKGEAEKSVVYDDLWSLNLTNSMWTQLKKHVQGPGTPSPRSSTAMAVVSKRRAILFGGVRDVDNDDDLVSEALGDAYVLQLDSFNWFPFAVHPKKASSSCSTQCSATESKAYAAIASEDSEGEEEEEEKPSIPLGHATTTADGNVEAGKEALSPQLQGAPPHLNDAVVEVCTAASNSTAAPSAAVFSPCSRHSTLLACQGNQLY